MIYGHNYTPPPLEHGTTNLEIPQLLSSTPTTEAPHQIRATTQDHVTIHNTETKVKGDFEPAFQEAEGVPAV